MLTVDFRRLPVGPGDRLLDLGCGGGRHAYEAYRRGADVVACDADGGELRTVAAMAAAMHETGEVPATAHAHPVAGDATAMPFGDEVFDRVIAAEMLEHIADDQRALHEIARVLRPGGLTVGGHHHAHGLHPPYWWLKCAVGVSDDDHLLVRAYHRLLVWDIMKHPVPTRAAERALNPLVGKSLVLYARKPVTQASSAAREAGCPERAHAGA